MAVRRAEPPGAGVLEIVVPKLAPSLRPERAAERPSYMGLPEGIARGGYFGMAQGGRRRTQRQFGIGGRVRARLERFYRHTNRRPPILGAEPVLEHVRHM